MIGAHECLKPQSHRGTEGLAAGHSAGAAKRRLTGRILSAPSERGAAKTATSLCLCDSVANSLRGHRHLGVRSR